MLRHRWYIYLKRVSNNKCLLFSLVFVMKISILLTIQLFVSFCFCENEVTIGLPSRLSTMQTDCVESTYLQLVAQHDDQLNNFIAQCHIDSVDVDAQLIDQQAAHQTFRKRALPAGSVPAVEAVSGGSTFSSFNGGDNEMIGFRFDVTTPIFVTALGLQDARDGVLDASHEIILWDETQTILAQETVSSSGDSLDSFFYTSLAVPVPLLPGIRYTIAGSQSSGDNDFYVSNPSTLQLASSVTNTIGVFPETTVDFAFPTGESSGNVGRIGPNFLFSTSVSAIGDPHLAGAHGEKYDFFGQPNGVYSLFSTPQFDVNMKLLDHGPKARFINEIGVVFRNVTLRFDTYAFKPVNKEKHLNALLKPVGGHAQVSPYTIELELCTGHRLTVVQRVDVDTIQKKKHTYYHLDIQIQVPGCHDSYDGALGQTYQCKYSNGEKFKFSHDDEEVFRVKHLFSTSGSFSSTAPCHEMDVFKGQQPAVGGSMDSAKMTERASMGAIKH